MTKRPHPAAGYGLAGGAVGWQVNEGLPSNESEWIYFALRAVAAIIGILIGR